eukprot:TRINITY_DN10297_c0_g1_i1.p1 TRINITY_DN10297_c0_g1~~TRINITY_DN10297_c0_g1_i1.p1  ORF type:complete len:428 (-),score=84.41 TRINITY_DN10297_c0_g1_i1:261-1544(-)
MSRKSSVMSRTILLSKGIFVFSVLILTSFFDGNDHGDSHDSRDLAKEPFRISGPIQRNDFLLVDGEKKENVRRMNNIHDTSHARQSVGKNHSTSWILQKELIDRSEKLGMAQSVDEHANEFAKIPDDLRLEPKYCPLVESWIKPNLTAEDILLQVEIPKTATTSFQFLLRSMCSRTSLKPKPLGRCKSAKCCHQKLRCQWYHAALLEAEKCGEVHGYNKNRYYPITFLRHPVNRVVSEYYEWTGHWWNAPNFSPALQAMRKNISLLEFIMHPDNPAHNRQLWMLTSFVRNKVRRSRDYTLFYEFWSKYYQTNTLFTQKINEDTQLLEATKRALEKEYAFVGLTELYPQSLKLFLYTFNAKGNVKTSRRLHTKPDKMIRNNTLEQSLVQLIMEKNKGDLALYSFALQLFKKRVGEMQKCLQEPPLKLD